MAQPVTDPELLRLLSGGASDSPAMPKKRYSKPVTDPELLARLEVARFV